MTKAEAKKRIEKLKKEVHRHRYLYHVLDAPELSDEATDALKKELADLEKQYPELLTPDSPTQRVGGLARDEFTKVPHEVAQWSFNDAFEEADVLEFHERTLRMLEKKHIKNPKPTYSVELKIDGLHVVLTYVKGIFTLGATRGDGKVGEDVTQNLRTIESIPLRLEKEVDVVVEGEVWLSKKQFAKINKEREKNGEPLYANPRNTAAGTIRQLDPEMVRKRKLDCFIYDLSKAGTIPSTQAKELDTLQTLGFKINKDHTLCKRIEDVVKYWKAWEKKKDSLPYMIDGVVVKVNELEYQNALGHTGKAPRFALALKFAPDQTTTIVEDIRVQVGRTGALTPVAHLKPVKIAGSTVRRATLHNEDEIKRLCLKIGDTVVIQKAGDIIPDVVEVLPKLRTGKEKAFHMPKQCPMCGGKVEKKKGEVALYCRNKDCFAKRLAELSHFVAKAAFAIDGLGIKLIEKLMNADLIRTPADIFSLTKDDLAPLEGLGEKSADNLIRSITRAKVIELSPFIFALGIRFIGVETADLIARLCPQAKRPKVLLSCMGKNSQNAVEAIEGIGEKSAASVHAWFTHKENKRLLTALDAAGITFKHSGKSIAQTLSENTYVLTGTFDSMTRDEAKVALKERGAKVSSSVSRNTTAVITGENPGSKEANAKKLGVPILSEKDLKKLLRQS